MRGVPSTNGVEIAVHELGGEGPPVLYAHATGLHGHCWEPIARRLPGFRNVAIDFRGHGDSSTPAEHDYRWEGFAEDVLATVDALGLERPRAAGHSKGGAALLLAEAARPGTFERLWCFDPVVHPGPAPSLSDLPENPLAAGAERRRSTFDSLAEATARFRSKPPFDVVAPEALDAYVLHGLAPRSDGTWTLKCPPPVEAQVYRMGRAHDGFAGLGRVGCPVTIVRADVHVPGPASFAAAIAAAIPDGTLEDHPELTHFGPLQDPDTMAASVRRTFTDPTTDA